MNANNVIVNLDRFITSPVTDREFFTSGLDMDGAFANKEEFAGFMIEIGSRYPEGVPWEYLWQRIESYKRSRLTESLKARGFIEYVDDDGEVFYRVAGKSNVEVTR